MDAEPAMLEIVRDHEPDEQFVFHDQYRRCAVLGIGKTRPPCSQRHCNLSLLRQSRTLNGRSLLVSRAAVDCPKLGIAGVGNPPETRRFRDGAGKAPSYALFR